MNNEKCFGPNADIYMVLLQIRSTPISASLPSPSTLLFNRMTRDILLKFSRQSVLGNYSDSNNTSLLERQCQASQDIDTCKNIPFLPTGSTVVVKREDGEPWMHGTIMGHETDDHNNRSYIIRVTKTGHAVTRMKRHIQPTIVSAKDHLQNKNTESQPDIASRQTK